MSPAEEQALDFRNNLPLQICLQEIERALGRTEKRRCLEIGSENGVFSLQLRRNGGTWRTVVASDAMAARVQAVLNEEVLVVREGAIPFEKKLFDVVVVFDFLERYDDDVAFIEQCHQALKPDGLLVVHSHRLGGFAPARWVRRALGLHAGRLGCVREGYTESALFRVLKNGFDVHVIRRYSRFFLEFNRALVDRLNRPGRPERGEAAVRRFHAAAGLGYRVAFQLDLLLLFSRGYRLVAVAKRRGWRPRNAPILKDGRTISEAVLSRPAR